MKQTITSHNTKILKTKQQEQEQHEAKKVTKTCNCQAKKDPCPMDKNCLQDCVVYQATVTQTETKTSENYIGLTADTFKVRHRNHKKSFNNVKYETETELSKHIWKLKRAKIAFTIKWRVIDRGRPFNPVSKVCQLCTTEKFYLIFKPHLCTLNDRNELGSYCRHQKSLLHCSKL